MGKRGKFFFFPSVQFLENSILKYELRYSQQAEAGRPNGLSFMARGSSSWNIALTFEQDCPYVVKEGYTQCLKQEKLAQHSLWV
jgi:hypothetical protein